MDGSDDISLERKIYSLGNARAIIIPSAWISAIQRKAGTRLAKVRVVMLDDRLDIYPYFEESPSSEKTE